MKYYFINTNNTDCSFCYKRNIPTVQSRDCFEQNSPLYNLCLECFCRLRTEKTADALAED